MHSIENRCVIGPENILFAGMAMRTAFSPEILQAGAVKGLNNTLSGGKWNVKGLINTLSGGKWHVKGLNNTLSGGKWSVGYLSAFGSAVVLVYALQPVWERGEGGGTSL